MMDFIKVLAIGFPALWTSTEASWLSNRYAEIRKWGVREHTYIMDVTMEPQHKAGQIVLEFAEGTLVGMQFFPAVDDVSLAPADARATVAYLMAAFGPPGGGQGTCRIDWDRSEVHVTRWTEGMLDVQKDATTSEERRAALSKSMTSCTRPARVQYDLLP